MRAISVRIFTVLEILQDRAEVSGAELARRLEVDPRTVRRYATRLQELGIPVEARRGRHGGYRLRPGYKLPPLMLTDDEAVAVVLGLAAAQRYGLATAEPAVDGALAKLRRVLPVALRERADALLATLGFTRGPVAAAPPATPTLLALADAARAGRRVRIGYTTWAGAAGERTVDPYGLVFHNGRWYLAARDGEEIRSLRVDRVARAEVLPDAVVPPPDGFDAVAHVSRSLARVPWRHEVEVVLDTTLAAARARIAPSVAELSGADGAVVMVCRAEWLDGMAQMLAGLGFPFTIRRPDALRAAVAALAERLLAAAADQPPASATS
jgi:predicted DNA-binding transcriptional regulator YafY